MDWCGLLKPIFPHSKKILEYSDRNTYNWGMVVSKKHQYGLLAMVYMGLSGDSMPLQLRAISDHTAIPHPFLEQIMAGLKHFGLVKSARGAKGGYRLALPATSICVWDIIQAMGPVDDIEATDSRLVPYWDGFSQHIKQYFDQSLHHICEDVRNAEGVLHYTI